MSLGAGLALFGQARAADVAATELDSVGALPTVITPTRLKQSLQEVPASVTVLTATQLRTYGVTSIADALRLVPGMAVTQATGNWYQVNYHGTSPRDARRMNVLIDGISVYRPGLSKIYWTQLPIVIDDVERIEVTRGPASAAYGPNSMTAVVNIITKRPSDVGQASMSAGAGSPGVYRTHARAALTSGDTSFLVAASTEGDRGYDWNSAQNDDHDSSTARRLLVRSQTQLSRTTGLALEGAYVEGRAEVPFRSVYEAPPDKRISDSYLAGTLTSALSGDHELQVRATFSHHRIEQRWATCFPAVAFLPQLYTLYGTNPAYANTLLMGQIPRGGTPADDLLALQAAAAIQQLGPAGLQPLCGLANQDLAERRADIELQDTFAVNEQLRLVSGLGARQQMAESQTFLAGRVTNNLYRLFGNVEYKPDTWATVNLGAYAEHDQIVGWTFSPRGAVNFQIDENQGIRFSVSKGTRTPDLQEQHGNYSFTTQLYLPAADGSTMAKYYQHSASAGGLKSEVEMSREVGYFLNLPKWGLLFDAKVFNDRLTDLISEPISIGTVAQTNSNSVRLRGVELQASASLDGGWSGFATYAYLLNTDATIAIEQAQYSRHSGSIGVSKVLGSGWRVSSAYFGSSGNGANTSYGRLDTIVSKAFVIADRQAEAMLRITRLDSPTLTYYAGSSRETSRYNNRLQAYAELKLSF